MTGISGYEITVPLAVTLLMRSLRISVQSPKYATGSIPLGSFLPILVSIMFLSGASICAAVTWLGLSFLAYHVVMRAPNSLIFVPIFTSYRKIKRRKGG